MDPIIRNPLSANFPYGTLLRFTTHKLCDKGASEGQHRWRNALRKQRQTHTYTQPLCLFDRLFAKVATPLSLIWFMGSTNVTHVQHCTEHECVATFRLAWTSWQAFYFLTRLQEGSCMCNSASEQKESCRPFAVIALRASPWRRDPERTASLGPIVPEATVSLPMPGIPLFDDCSCS